MWPSIRFSLIATALTVALVWLFNAYVEQREMSLTEIGVFISIMFIVSAVVYYFLQSRK